MRRKGENDEKGMNVQYFPDGQASERVAATQNDFFHLL